MDRCLLCGQDTGNHHETCPDARSYAPTVFVDHDEIARGRAALEADATESGSDPVVDEPAVPWSIPIREPAATAASPRRSDDDEHRRLLGLVAGGVVLLVVAIVGALLIGDDPGSPRSTEVAGSQTTRAIDVTTTTAALVSTSSTTAPSTTTTESTTTVPPTTAEPAPAPVRADTGDVPILTPGQIGRGWVAQMSSVPRSAGGRALQTAYETITDSSPSAVVIISDEWPALRSGYWVIVVPGFDTGADAVGACDAAGRSGDECFARFLSANAEQNARSCSRARDGSLSGDCGA